MIDQKLLREHPDIIRDALKRRGSAVNLDALLAVEQERRTLLTALEADRHALKQGSEEFGRQKAGKDVAPPAHLKQLSERIKQQEQRLNDVEDEARTQLAYVPNIPHQSVPTGDAQANQIVRTVGQPPSYAFTPKTHLELAQQLRLIDFEQAAKITGSHFPLYTGDGARLERALINWMLDVHTKEHGYVEVSPPYLVNRASMFSTGQLPYF